MRRLAIGMNLIIVLCLLATCGGSQREKTIKATLVAVNQARDAFIVFDQKAQNAIADTAPSRESGAALLVRYRQKRESVVEAFALAYRAIAAAATANDDPSVAAMIVAAREIAASWQAFKEANQ